MQSRDESRVDTALTNFQFTEFSHSSKPRSNYRFAAKSPKLIIIKAGYVVKGAANWILPAVKYTT